MSNAELPPKPIGPENGVRPLLTAEETRELREAMHQSYETVLRPWMEKKAARETIHHLPPRLANLRFKE